jgi:DNA polymerase III subunit gamma/tau
VAYQSLYRRYRSRRFGELVGQQHVVTALRNAVREGRTGHAYLFSGPRGTGKTSVARILAKALNCTDLDDGEPCGRCESCLAIDAGRSYDLYELDAASNNGVEAMRDLINKAAIGSPGRSKVYILDEVHMLSTAASNALLKTLEEPPDHVTFVLATTDPQRVLPTIRSRCQHLEFGLIPAAELEAHVRWVAADAGIELDDEAVTYVVRRGGGSARDTLSVLEQVAALGGVPAGGEPLDGLLDSLLERDTAAALGAVAQLVAGGREPRLVGEQLLARLRDAFLTTMGAAPGSVPAAEVEDAGRVGRALGPAGLTRALEALGEALVEMRQAPDARVPLEVALIRLTRPELDTSVAALVERVARLERRLAEQPGGVPDPEPEARTAPGATPSSKPGAVDAPGTPVPAGTAVPAVPAVPAGAAGPAAEARRRIQARDANAPVGTPPTTGPDGAAPRRTATPPAPVPETTAPTPPQAGGPFSPETGAPAGDVVLPSTEELAAAWRDAVLETLAPAAKARFRAGRFLGVVDGGAEAVYGLPNAIHRDRCEERRPEVEAALARHFGRPVPLRLVVDDAGALPPGEAPPPFEPTSDAERAGRMGSGRAPPAVGASRTRPAGDRIGVVRGRPVDRTSGGGTDGVGTDGAGTDGVPSDEDPDIDLDDLHALPDATDVVATVTDRIMQAFPGSQVVE